MVKTIDVRFRLQVLRICERFLIQLMKSGSGLKKNFKMRKTFEGVNNDYSAFDCFVIRCCLAVQACFRPKKILLSMKLTKTVVMLPN